MTLQPPIDVCVGIGGCCHQQLCDELASDDIRTNGSSLNVLLLEWYVRHMYCSSPSRVSHPVALAHSIPSLSLIGTFPLSILLPVPSYLSSNLDQK